MISTYEVDFHNLHHSDVPSPPTVTEISPFLKAQMSRNFHTEKRKHLISEAHYQKTTTIRIYTMSKLQSCILEHEFPCILKAINFRLLKYNCHAHKRKPHVYSKCANKAEECHRESVSCNWTERATSFWLITLATKASDVFDFIF